MAGEQRLNRHAVANIDPPARSRSITDGFNHTQWFVAGDVWHGHPHAGGKLFAVGPANSASFNAQQRIVVLHFGHRNIHRLEFARCGQHHRQGVLLRHLCFPL